MVLLLEQQEQEMQRCSPNLVKDQPVMWEQFANNLYVNIWSFLPCTRPQKLWMKQDFDAE